LRKLGKEILSNLRVMTIVYRLRVGNYRVKIFIDGDECVVFDVEKRERGCRQP